MTSHGDARGHLAALDDLGRPVSRIVDGGRQKGLDAPGAAEVALLTSAEAIALDAVDAIFERLGEMRNGAEVCIAVAPLVDDDGLTRQLGELAALLDVAGTYVAALLTARRASARPQTAAGDEVGRSHDAPYSVSEERGD